MTVEIEMDITEKEPISLFKSWLDEATLAETINPHAMTLATVNGEGKPSARMVLLKNVDTDGFVFYTNLGSQKAADLTTNPNAALCFYWKSIAKQVRVEGKVSQVTTNEADEYFAGRPRLSQIGAWASKQSELLNDRVVLDKRIARFTEEFTSGSIPRPKFWSGYRLIPDRIEFWKEEAFRLHNRTLYVQNHDSWSVQRLYP